jgi:hypothetical protein
VYQKMNVEKVAVIIALIIAANFVLRQATTGWKKITSPEGAFTCLMPATPKVDSQTFETSGIKLQGKVLSARNRANSQFTLSYFDGPTSLSTEEGEKMLDRQGQFLTQGDSSRMVFAEKLVLRGYSGRHYTAHTENNTETDEMVYLVKRRLYLLLVVHDRGGAQEDVKRFFESFVIEPQ